MEKLMGRVMHMLFMFVIASGALWGFSALVLFSDHTPWFQATICAIRNFGIGALLIAAIIGEFKPWKR